MTPTVQMHISEDQKQEAQAELARILKSDFFRGSRNCCRFLEYSVLHTLQGNAPSDMRERIMGVEVFDRPTTYNASDDPIVRVTANDVRKRLAQFYSGANVEDSPVISLPSGLLRRNFHLETCHSRTGAGNPSAAASCVAGGQARHSDSCSAGASGLSICLFRNSRTGSD